MKKVTCIVPTYNESKRISNILNVVSDHPLIDEVIVVDDGSKDNTADIVKSYPNIRLVIHEINRGKSAAVYTGITKAEGEFILLVDADLIGLEKENISNLIKPVVENKCDVSFSLRGNTPFFWKKIGLDYITGERVFRKSILDKHLEEILKLPKFGLESFFNIYIIKNRCRIKVVDWDNVASPYKYEKIGLLKGLLADMFMINDIFKTIGIFGPFIQIFKLKKQIVK
jgi:glycosyltransferase involved in cell wall biosynthesis